MLKDYIQRILPSPANNVIRKLNHFVKDDGALMLVPRKGGWEVTYYTLDITPVYDFISDLLDTQMAKGEIANHLLDEEFLSHVKIYATGDLQPSKYENAFNITSVAARKGFGPVAYDTFLKLAKSRGIIPARKNIRGMTKSATGVWDFYFNNRNDVEAEPIENKRIYYHRGEEKPVDHVFYDDGIKLDYSKAAAKHKENIKELQGLLGAKNISTAVYNTEIHNKGTEFFKKKYEDAD